MLFPSPYGDGFYSEFNSLDTNYFLRYVYHDIEKSLERQTKSA